MSPGSLYLESTVLRLSVIRLRALCESPRDSGEVVARGGEEKELPKACGPGRDCQVPLSSRGMWQMAVQALSF